MQNVLRVFWELVLQSALNVMLDSKCDVDIMTVDISTVQ